MKVRVPHPWLSAALLVGAGALIGLLVAREAPSANPAAACAGEYADTLQTLAPRTRDLEQSRRAEFTYLVRSTAKYECPYFGSDGKLRRRTLEVFEHGTAFAYEVTNGETYLLTNEHVAVWPEVTDSGRRVDGVPEGCKRLQERLRIVHDEHDRYEAGHIPLQRVATDPLLDAAILKASQALTALPYEIGKSAALRGGNAVQVRGFPLGLLHAVNTGKVVNAYDLDQEQGWDHVDFVIDALLSEGNSGSPVLALSCRSGELQLVGMYHAGYKGHSALNVVVGIDQLRDFMLRKRRVPRASSEGGSALAAAARKRLREALAAPGTLPLFEFGGLHAMVEAQGETLRYHLYGRDFPVDDRRLAIVEERPGQTGAGEVARLWVRGDAGHRELPTGDLGGDERELLARLIEGLRAQAGRVLAYRRALAAAPSSEERARGRELLRAIDRAAVPARELAGSLKDLIDRVAPGSGAVASVNVDAGAPPPGAPPLRAPR